MRIVCTVTNDLRQDQRMERVCHSLQTAGHTVTLVGRRRPGSLPLPPRPYAQHRISCRFSAGKAFYLEYNWRLWRTLRHWEYDVIYSVDLDTLWAGVRLTRRRRHRLVFDAHEWFSETPEVVPRPLVRAFWRRLGRWGAPRADARMTVAPVLATKLAAEYGVPFGTVRNLPWRNPPYPAAGRENPPTPSPTPFLSGADQKEAQAERKVLLYQGMLNPRRGLETAIAALAELPDCELWLVGAGPEAGALRGCGVRYGVADRVRFLGFQPPEALPALTRRAWLGLNLLDAVSPSYYYSLANKALDYVQAGLPSVQMDFPEYRALQEEYGCYLLLPSLDPARLATLIRELTGNPDRYATLRVSCLAAAEVLCWEREEKELLKMFARLPADRE